MDPATDSERSVELIPQSFGNEIYNPDFDLGCLSNKELARPRLSHSQLDNRTVLSGPVSTAYYGNYDK